MQWLEWRKHGIGSSDAPAIHGKSPYKTALELWNEKVSSEVKDEASGYILEKGNRLEPIFRSRFQSLLAMELNLDEINFEPKLFELESLNFLRASLDGYAFIEGYKIGIEIKLVGQAVWKAVANESLPIRGGRVPENYWIQMQHQMTVTGLDKMYFVAGIDERESLNYCLVTRDEEFITHHVAKCSEFWKSVLKKREPEPSDQDFKPIKAKGAKGKAGKLAKLMVKQKQIEIEVKELRAELLALCNHPRQTCGGLKFTKVTRKGSVDYSKIPELFSVDLENYRGPSVESWRIDFEK
jgi:putative phage-type endonuclease